ncbi:MAG: SAM-dependent methyltransferase, tRNA(uracil-5)-methyltransferase [Planctomycetota bacterium]|nr:SAM-dependent methyltransferase, tRNA(uracil-5)-methyltransferase [Planctomycetota bacterium]
MRPTTETAAEIEHSVLTTVAGNELMQHVSSVAKPTPRDLMRWRKTASAEFVSAALRMVEGRRRGAAKFSRADRMWFDPIALEQATPELVAQRKAARFAGSDVLDFCCGIGGDAIALATSARRVLAVDLDPGMLRRARWNAQVYEVADRILGVLGRAEQIAIPGSALVHIDPDRRAAGGLRSKAIAGYAPGLEFLRDLPSRCRGGAIKLGPASDFAEHFTTPGLEIELISLGGECKEATVWFGSLATCRRRATVLPDGASWTDRDGGGSPRFSPIGDWIFDPDPSLIRAGLLDGFASAHGLSRFEPGIDLLTASSPISSPFLSTIAVDEVLPLDLKTLRRIVRERGLGPLEIKTRGVDLLPEDVRHILRPEGPNAATIVLAGSRAIVGHRPSKTM